MKRQSSSKHDPPTPGWRYGWAVALGMGFGLIPKDSALCYLFALLALFLPISVPAAIVSAVTFSVLAPLLDRWTDPIGFWLLSQPALEDFWRGLEATAVAVWFRSENTVVVGSIALALIAFLPTGWLVARLAGRLRRAWPTRAVQPRPLVPGFAPELES
jgi:uncharacterized protein (TIGR03546 family)